MGMKDLADKTSGVSESQTEEKQSKSLIANVYSNDGSSDPDSYKNLDDWELDQEDIHLAWRLVKGSDNKGTEGMVRDTAAILAPSGDHEEWFSELVIKLAHRIGELREDNLPDGQEPKGPTPIMEFLAIDADDVLQYIRDTSDHEMAEELFTQLSQAQEQMEQAEEQEADEEEAEA